MNTQIKACATENSEIAIIGMACRFPGAENPDVFWKNVREGKESISFFSDEEMLAAGIDPQLLSNPNYVKAHGELTDIDRFDASFFGFSPREAELMDPQHRLYLECVWEALENSGYAPESYQGLIGLYAGAGMNTYLLRNLYPNQKQLESVSEFQIMLANDKDHLATQTAYRLNLQGPIVTVQTACSTSLVAVHLAAQSLLGGESDMALAGAISVSVPQRRGYLYQDGMVLSPDGRCRAFDAEANGFVSGSGVGVVVMKRLAEAMADNDQIHAVIKASAINNDGSMKVGYTAPSVRGQAEVIAEALALAEVDPDTISYVEAHGSGTALGDPVEIEALRQVYENQTPKKAFCAVGSVKTNVGHLDTAAGMAGLIKAVQALRHRMIPPSINCQKPNPQIDFANSPFFVNTELRPWDTNGTPRRAGVSSFGQGGTNAHMILEEAPAPAPSEKAAARTHHLLTLSAKSEDALKTLACRYDSFLDGAGGEASLADICYTANVGRSHFSHRLAVVASSNSQASTALARIIDEGLEGKYRGQGVATDQSTPMIAFWFSGNTARQMSLGRGLYENHPLFRQAIMDCEALWQSLQSESLIDALETDVSGRTPLTDAACPVFSFALEYALAKLWQAWGIRPAAVSGLGAGWWAAACVAGSIDLEAGLQWFAGKLTAAQLTLQAPCIPLLAAKTGHPLIWNPTFDAEFWDNASLTSAGDGGMAFPNREGFDACLVLGAVPEQESSAEPHASNTGSVRLPSLLTDRDGWEALLETLATFYVKGATIDWGAFHNGYERRRVALPNYPFQRRRYWIEAPAPDGLAADVSSEESAPLPSDLAPVAQQRSRVDKPAIDASAPEDLVNRILSKQLQAASRVVSKIASQQLTFLAQDRSSAPDESLTGQPPGFKSAVLPNVSDSPDNRGQGTAERAQLKDNPGSRSGPFSSWHLLPLAAETTAALETETARLAEYLRQHPEVHLADIAHERLNRCESFRHRCMAVCRDADDARQTFETPDSPRIVTNAPRASTRSVAFMFPGIGDQYVNMAKGLCEQDTVFRQELNRCCAIVKTHLKHDIKAVLYPREEFDASVEKTDENAGVSVSGFDFRQLLGGQKTEPHATAQRLNQTVFAHPAVFTVAYSLARQWIEWGIQPKAMIGHSLGEYVAACLSGVMSLEDALRLVVRRAQLVDELPEGMMLAVPLPEAEIQPLLVNGVSLAVVNAPSVCVLSGAADAVVELEERLNDKGVPSRRLQASRAFHSPMMKSLSTSFSEVLNDVTLCPPQIPYVSNVTGTWITKAQATDADYWLRHTFQTVRFADGITTLLRTGPWILLEVGPGQSLGSFVLQYPASEVDADMVVLPSLRHVSDNQPDEAFLLSTLGRLWVEGLEVTWDNFFVSQGKRTALKAGGMPDADSGVHSLAFTN